MNILFVVEHFPPHIGGGENAFFEMSRALGGLGLNVRVATSDSGGVTGMREYGPVRAFYYPWRSVAGHPIPSTRDLDEHVRWADIVQTTTYSAALPAFFVSRKYGKKIVLTVLEVLGKRWFQTVKNPVLALAYYCVEKLVITRGYDHWVCISEATSRDLLNSSNISRAKVSTALLAVDTTLFNPCVQPLPLNRLFHWTDNSRIFLFFGRPGVTKGADLLLEAISMSRTQLPPDIRFGFILSRNPPRERAKFERRLAELRLGDIASTVDSVPRDLLPAYLKGASCIVVPSRTEGFGFSACEASHLDVPVISSNAGSLPEVVFGQVLLFETGSAAALSEALIKASNRRFEQIGAKSFSWENTAQSLMKIFDKLL